MKSAVIERHPDVVLHPVLPDLPSPAVEAGLPVLNYSTGAGWHTWGHARSERGARRIVERNLPASAKSLLGHGFRLSVMRRSALQRELSGGPDGFVWSMGK